LKKLNRCAIEFDIEFDSGVRGETSEALNHRVIRLVVNEKLDLLLRGQLV
jgi:hypothetical protein